MTHPFTIGEALQSFIGPICPSCGWSKKTKLSFCLGCYSRLPGELQRALHDQDARKYMDALNAARVWLAENPQAKGKRQVREVEA